MTLRTAHGVGVDALVRVETLPVDELPALPVAPQRGPGFQKGNRHGKGRKPVLACSGGMPLDAKDPTYKRCLAQARRYRRARIRELSLQHGGEVSAGVSAMITSASLDLAMSRYLATRAAMGDKSAIASSSRLAATARQLELTALEIASREAAGRASHSPPSLPAPPAAPPPWQTE
jgi:hypothetical protein